MKGKKLVRNIVIAIAFVVWYLIFSYSMFLGLQVNTTYGMVAVIISLGSLGLLIYGIRKWK